MLLRSTYFMSVLYDLPECEQGICSHCGKTLNIEAEDIPLENECLCADLLSPNMNERNMDKEEQSSFEKAYAAHLAYLKSSYGY